MSSFWAWWVMALIVLNLGVALFLYLWAPRVKIPVLPDGTSGHVWSHGDISEGVRPLPRWWLLMSGGLFVLGIGYLVLFPGFGNFKGVLDWTAHGELAQAVANNDRTLDPLMKRFAQMPVATLASDPAALQMGHVLFEDNCAACHGSAGRGNPLVGAPNLTDNDWLYGGDGQALITSLQAGRAGVMPAWASLGEANVKNLTQYVLSLSDAPHDAAKAAAGKPLFTACSACHGADGKGNLALGAPNLTDHIWLYGGTAADIEQTLNEGRQGKMPAWSPRLSDDQIRVLAAYVHHLSHPADVVAR
jgi:cytochrome c oxidase cbb3-type subunit 3